MKYDLLIKDGTVIDGTGKERFEADIGIVGDRIAAIGSLGIRLRQAATGIDATVVNGEVLIVDGEHTGALPGRVLKH